LSGEPIAEKLLAKMKRRRRGKVVNIREVIDGHAMAEKLRKPVSKILPNWLKMSEWAPVAQHEFFTRCRLGRVRLQTAWRPPLVSLLLTRGDVAFDLPLRLLGRALPARIPVISRRWFRL